MLWVSWGIGGVLVLEICLGVSQGEGANNLAAARPHGPLNPGIPCGRPWDHPQILLLESVWVVYTGTGKPELHGPECARITWFRKVVVVGSRRFSITSFLET